MNFTNTFSRLCFINWMKTKQLYEEKLLSLEWHKSENNFFLNDYVESIASFKCNAKSPTLFNTNSITLLIKFLWNGNATKNRCKRNDTIKEIILEFILGRSKSVGLSLSLWWCLCRRCECRRPPGIWTPTNTVWARCPIQGFDSIFIGTKILKKPVYKRITFNVLFSETLVRRLTYSWVLGSFIFTGTVHCPRSVI